MRSSRGGDGTPKPVSLLVRVPRLYSLNVGGVSATLVDNDKFEPEQVLVVTISDAVRGADLSCQSPGLCAAPAQGRGVKQRLA